MEIKKARSLWSGLFLFDFFTEKFMIKNIYFTLETGKRIPFMPKKDIYHDAVKQALIREGWIITHDPFHLRYGGFDFFIDLGAKGLFGASKNDRHIAVEVKSFLGPSSLQDFHLAVGQILNYQIVLRQSEPDRKLFLAVPEYIFDSFFSTPFGELAVSSHRVNIIVFDEDKEVIIRWIEQQTT